MNPHKQRLAARKFEGDPRSESSRTPSAATVAEADVETVIMAALDLAMDYAYHDGTERELAVAATANELAGYRDVGFGVAHASRDQVATAVEAALRGRPKRLLRADARGMLQAFDMLARSGAISYTTCSACHTQRWLARGGHDRVTA